MKKLLILSTLLFLSFLSRASIIYIDPSASVNGNGTMESPYNTWNSVSTWNAGNSYLQKSGTVWNKTIEIKGSGYSGSYINIGAYGEGDRPRIETNNEPGIKISSRSYIKISDFHIITTGQERYWLTTGIYGMGGNYNIIENVEIGPAAGHGIYLQNHHNLIVRSCKFYRSGTKDEWDSCDNIHLENCHDYLVEYCISYNALQGAVYDASDGPNAYTTGTWQYNIGYRTPDANTVHSNWSIFKMSGNTSGSKVKLLYNIAYGSFNGPAFALQEKLDATAIGNVAYDCVSGFQQVPAGNIIKNNIVMDCNEVIYFPEGKYPSAMNHNLYFNNNKYTSGGTITFATLSDFQSATGLDQNSMVSDPKFTDAENFDFTLQSISPAIDAGEDISLSLGNGYKMALDPWSVWTDSVLIVDQSKHGAGWDIGAFAYVTSFFNLNVNSEYGSIDPIGRIFPRGYNVTITANPDDGYVFDSWSGDIPSEFLYTNPVTITMDSEKSITAHFSLMSDINEVSGSAEFKVYPNPVKDYLFIEYENTINEYSLKITDILGKCLIHKSFYHKCKIDLTAVPYGIYFISFFEREKIFESKRFIKM